MGLVYRHTGLSMPGRALPQVPGDQDIADLLSALDEGSTAAPGGLYAAALPAAPASEGAAGSQQAAAGHAAGEEQETVEGAAAPAGPSDGKVAAVCAAVRAALERRDKVRGRTPSGTSGRVCKLQFAMQRACQLLTLPSLHNCSCKLPSLLPSPTASPGLLPASHPDQPRQVRAAGGGAGAGAGCQGGGASGQWGLLRLGSSSCARLKLLGAAAAAARRGLVGAGVASKGLIRIALPCPPFCRAGNRRAHQPLRTASSTCCSLSPMTRCACCGWWGRLPSMWHWLGQCRSP